jgi:UDP-N-acetylglucosamine acyltransferase
LSAAEIHPQALVSPGAELGSGVSVGPFAVIEDGVRVGDGTRIQASAYLCSGTTLGRDNVVHMGAVLGPEPQARGTAPDTETRIGSDCFFMANSHAAHNCRVGDGVTLANGALLGGHVEVGDGAFLSGNAVVHQRIRVGRLAMIQGSSAASCDVPPFCNVSSLNELRGINVVGLRRAGVEAHGIAAIRRAYRMLFHGRPNLGRARTRLAEELDRSDGWTPEVRELLEFLEGGQSFCSVRSRRSS